MKKSLLPIFLLLVIFSCSDNSTEPSGPDYLGTAMEEYTDDSKTIRITWKKLKYGGYEFKMYKSEIPLIGEKWIKFDDFIISRSDSSHHHVQKLYPFFKVDYSVTLEYEKGRVHTKGTVKQYDIFGDQILKY